MGTDLLCGFRPQDRRKSRLRGEWLLEVREAEALRPS